MHTHNSLKAAGGKLIVILKTHQTSNITVVPLPNHGQPFTALSRPPRDPNLGREYRSFDILILENPYTASSRLTVQQISEATPGAPFPPHEMPPRHFI